MLLADDEFSGAEQAGFHIGEKLGHGGFLPC
jgi:hypothetical protein